ncbi:MAG: FKBP-type peptidyl-prolyl cis-trans isomerase [Bacteroidota bacterium]
MGQDIKDVSYCIGMSISGSLIEQNLNGIDTTVMAEAIADIFAGKAPKFSPEQANQIIQQFLAEESEAQFAANKIAGEEFLIQNKANSNVQHTSSGLQYEVINAGEGPKPAATDTVSVHYHGTLIDGTIFDSSVQRGQAATFGVHQVIPGWTEALQLMPVGAKYRLYIPQELAYGATPHPGGPIKPYSALIFDVELLNIV